MGYIKPIPVDKEKLIIGRTVDIESDIKGTGNHIGG